LKVFEYSSGRNLGPKAISELLKKQDIKGSSLKTVRRDLESMGTWLPEAVMLIGDGMVASAEIIGTLRIIRQRLINLGDTADNSAARVGALRAAADTAFKEIEIRLKAGQIKPVPQKLELMNDVSEDRLSEYVSAIAELVVAEYNRSTLRRFPEDGEPQDSKKSMDTAPANEKTEGVPTSQG
jgi:hypothetical protein